MLKSTPLKGIKQSSLSACPLQLLNHLADLHEIWH